jgi:hypothetical protein
MLNIAVDKTKPLWTLKGPGWALPILVSWPETNDMAAVELHPQVHLLAIQREAALKRLQEFGYCANGRFWVLGYKLLKIACPAVAENPEELVEWSSRYNQTINPEMTPDMKDFIDDFCRYGWSANPEKTKILWAAMCRHMLEWLLVRNRSLDLGFVELFAPPLRADWHNQFIMKWSNRLHGKLRRTFAELMTKSTKTKQEIANPEYLASLCDGTVAMRRVQVIHKTAWWKNLFRIEKTRSKTRYWHEIKSLVEQYHDTALRSLRAYIHEVLAPVPFRIEKGHPSSKGIPENWAPAPSDLVEIDIGGEICAIAVRDTKLKSYSEPFDLVAKTEGL